MLIGDLFLITPPTRTKTVSNQITLKMMLYGLTIIPYLLLNVYITLIGDLTSIVVKIFDHYIYVYYVPGGRVIRFNSHSFTLLTKYGL